MIFDLLQDAGLWSLKNLTINKNATFQLPTFKKSGAYKKEKIIKGIPNLRYIITNLNSV